MTYTTFIWPLLVSAALLGGITLYARRHFDVPVIHLFTFLTWLCAAWTIIFALYAIKWAPIRRLDPIPVMLVITGALFIWTVLRIRLFDVASIAHNDVMKNMEGLAIVLDMRGHIMDFNRAAQTALALSPATIGAAAHSLSQPWADLFERCADIFDIKQQVTLNFEDSPRVYDLTISTILDKHNRKQGRLFLFYNITDRKMAEEKLRQLSQAVEQSPSSIIITDTHGTIEYVNPRFTQVTGYSLEEAVGLNPRVLKTDLTPPETHRELWETLTAGRDWHGEFINRKKNGGIYYESASISPILDAHGAVTHYVAVKLDITKRKQIEDELRTANQKLQVQLETNLLLQAELREQAIRDPLTNLYNRRFLDETLERELAYARREEKNICIAMIDVDHFKEFNDRYGHKAGDMILKSLGDILLANTRRSDVGCRYGGEEFVVVMPDANLGDARKRAQQWRKAFQVLQNSFNEQALQATVSIGIASFPEHGEDGDTVLHAADMALYESKQRGRNRVTVYQEVVNE